MRERSSVDVIVISQVPPPVHGSTVMTLTFLEALRAAGLRTHLVDRRFSRSVDEIGGTSMRKIVSAFSLIGRLARSLRCHRGAKVVFFTTNRAPSFWVDVAMSALLRTTRRSYIAYIHTAGYSEVAARPGRRWAVRCLLGGAANVVVLGPSMRSDVRQFNDQLSEISNTVAGPVAPARPGSNNPTIAFVSNLIPGKGAEDFIRIANACLVAIPDARAVLVGGSSDPSYTESLRSMLDPLVQDRFLFTGALYGGARDEVVAAASLLVFPSTYQYEAQPLTVLEALRLGVPVVAYDVGGLRDVVENDVNGYLVDRGDWSAAARRCQAVLTSVDLSSNLAAGARDVFAQRFGFDGYTAAWTAVIQGRG